MSQTDRAHVADEMIIESDVPIEMDDGLPFRAQIFDPVGSGFHPVLLSHGPFAEGGSFQAPAGSHLQTRGDPAGVGSCGLRRGEVRMLALPAGWRRRLVSSQVDLSRGRVET